MNDTLSQHGDIEHEILIERIADIYVCLNCSGVFFYIAV